VFRRQSLAAMPSLHFATSVMAALLLAEVGPLAGAVGFAYAGTLGFALVYLGEHYLVDLLAGTALTLGVRRMAPRAGPALAALGTGWSALRSGPERRPEREGGSTRQMAGRQADGGEVRRAALGGAEEEMPRVVLTRRQIVLFSVFILSGVAFLYFVLAEARRRRHHRAPDRARPTPGGFAVGIVLELAPSPVRGVVPRRVRPRTRADRLARGAIRSRWPASSPRGCSPPPVRAVWR